MNTYTFWGLLNCTHVEAIVTMQISSDNLTPNLLVAGLGIFCLVASVSQSSVFYVFPLSLSRFLSLALSRSFAPSLLFPKSLCLALTLSLSLHLPSFS